MQTKKTMKTATKALLLSLCAVVLVAASVLGTIAYLISQDSVVNTFTVGNVTITMDETDVDLYGDKDGETRVKANNYKLIPGHTYTKDPVVHVDAASEDCWLFVKVENAIADIEDDSNTILAQMTANGWTRIVGETDEVYAYNTKVAGGTNVKVFESFTVDGSVTDVSAYNGKNITLTAIAVQADGFTAATNAWVAYKEQP